MRPTCLDRRTLLKSLMSMSLATALAGNGFAATSGATLPARRPGEMDIHHIDTGRGNCTLIIAPDGTTLMIDAGASGASLDASGQPRPNDTRRPGEWQARYAMRVSGNNHLDYLIVTHVHPDHVGDVGGSNPQAAGKAYRLTGVSDVDELMPIHTVVDRSFPDYADTHPPTSAFAGNYLAYLNARHSEGRGVQRAEVGSEMVIGKGEKAMRLRFLAGNGCVWDRATGEIRSPRPALASLAKEDRPSENFYSLAMRFSYGRFSYYQGGDLTSETFDGRLPWMDLETPAVQSAGRTEVATADHHGYFDACGPAFVRSLDAQAYVIQGWDVGHPGSAQMQRLLGAWGSTARHDVFATDLLPANALTNRRFVPMLKSRRGHVVVRIANGGASYNIYVVDSSVEDGAVQAFFGPYLCRAQDDASQS